MESFLGALVGAVIGSLLLNGLKKKAMRSSEDSFVDLPPKSLRPKPVIYTKPDTSKGRTPKVNDERSAWIKEHDL